jgi:hypothetical protein
MILSLLELLPAVAVNPAFRVENSLSGLHPWTSYVMYPATTAEKKVPHESLPAGKWQ